MLNHVKENDLAHGDFINWLKKINIERTEAHRFMKVAKELPNVDNWQLLSNRALYTCGFESISWTHFSRDG